MFPHINNSSSNCCCECMARPVPSHHHHPREWRRDRQPTLCTPLHLYSSSRPLCTLRCDTEARESKFARDHHSCISSHIIIVVHADVFQQCGGETEKVDALVGKGLSNVTCRFSRIGGLASGQVCMFRSESSA